MMFNTGEEILRHFAEKLPLVYGAAEFHRLRMADMRESVKSKTDAWRPAWDKAQYTASVTGFKCTTIWKEGLQFTAEEFGLTIPEPTWEVIDGDLLALSQDLCADCKAKPPAKAETFESIRGKRKRYYKFLDAYIQDMHAAAAIVQTYINEGKRIGDDVAQDVVWEARKTAELLVHAGSCTAFNAFTEHDFHGRKKPRIGIHLRQYLPGEHSALWFGLRPEGLCPTCEAASVPPTLVTTKAR